MHDPPDRPAQPPIDGLAGKIWRTMALPLRLISPLRLAGLRTVRRRWWRETVEERPGAGPDIHVLSAPDMQPPKAGAGPLNHRSYSLQIRDSTLSPAEVIERFRADPNAHSPSLLATFVPDPAPHGLRVGDDVEVKIPGPWDGPVRVAVVDDQRIRLETRDGHMEAGRIEFTAIADRNDPARTTVTIESYARSGDPIFDALYHRLGIAKFVQTEMWVQVLEALARTSGGRADRRAAVVTVIYQGAEE